MKKILLALIISTGLFAYGGTTKAIVGVETGYGQFDYSSDDINVGRTSSSEDFGILGLKIGAESEEYRIFLDAKYYQVGGAFDYANSFGGSFQYLMFISRDFNFFFGVTGGLMNLKVVDSEIAKSYEYSDPYFGGDIGFNYEVHEKLGFEVGIRYLNINATNTQYYNTDPTSDNKMSRTYTLDQMMNIYASMIFKYYVD